MPTTNPNITFARIRVDTQRLIALAQSDTLREQVKKLLAVYDMLERRFDEQPPAVKSVGYIKKNKWVQTPKNLWGLGYGAFRKGLEIDECPYEGDDAQHWRDGYLEGKRKLDAEKGETNA